MNKEAKLMNIDMKKPCSLKTRLHASVTSIDSGQPAQSRQAGLSQIFAINLFSVCSKTILPYDSVGC